MNILLAVNSNKIFSYFRHSVQHVLLACGSLFGGGMRGSRGAAAGGGGGSPRWGAAVLVLAGAWRWGAFSGAVTDGE